MYRVPRTDSDTSNVRLNYGAVLTADARWSTWATGGGCTALARHLDDSKPEGGWWWITVLDDPCAPETMEEPVVLGLYNADGECIGTWHCSDVWHALSIANGMAVGDAL